MGSTYKFNLLIYFLVFRIGIRHLPGYYDPFIFPLFPLFAFCLLFCFLLVLPAAASWLGFLFSPPLKALEFYCSDKNAKACGY